MRSSSQVSWPSRVLLLLTLSSLFVVAAPAPSISAKTATTAPVNGLDQQGMNYLIGVSSALLFIVVATASFYAVGSIDFTEDDSLITVDVVKEGGSAAE